MQVRWQQTFLISGFREPQSLCTTPLSLCNHWYLTATVTMVTELARWATDTWLSAKNNCRHTISDLCWQLGLAAGRITRVWIVFILCWISAHVDTARKWKMLSWYRVQIYYGAYNLKSALFNRGTALFTAEDKSIILLLSWVILDIWRYLVKWNWTYERLTHLQCSLALDWVFSTNWFFSCVFA